MSRRFPRALTLVLLALLILAPLSSGDKGLWLSLAATPLQLFTAPADHLSSEHSTLLPDKAARVVSAARTDATRSLGPSGTASIPGFGERWTAVSAVPAPVLREVASAGPAPRAPPA